jgi:F-type H+-transporting ATPase subunit epsilon
MAEQKLLQLTIARVDAPVFTGGVVSVTVPGTEGEMTLMADHEAIISVLKEGVITYRLPDNTAEIISVNQGTLEVRDNVATILI